MDVGITVTFNDATGALVPGATLVVQDITAARWFARRKTTIAETRYATIYVVTATETTIHKYANGKAQPKPAPRTIARWNRSVGK